MLTVIAVELDFHVEKRFHVTEKINVDISNVKFIYADEDELIHIAGMFDNIPMHSESSISIGMVWYGDIARTIIANLW